MAEHGARYGGLDDEFGQLEEVQFDTCSYAEYLVMNLKMTERYRYPGDGEGYLKPSCAPTASGYTGSKLCQSYEASR